ncbi:hypothetical protein PFISCL1PPCAC_5889, partial [Pristionchus fissidentatus]
FQMGWVHLGACILLILPVLGLFEDQIGKFDWRQRFVGCPTQVSLDRSRSGRIDNILLTSKEQAVAAISLNNGEIAWRRIQEKNTTDDIPFATSEQLMVTVTDNGRSVRGWEKAKGGLRWNVWLTDTPSTSVSVGATGDLVAVVSGNTIYGIEGSDITSYSWKGVITKSDWSRVSTMAPSSSTGSSSLTRSELVLVTGISGQKVTLTPIDASGLSSEGSVSIAANWFDPERCLISREIIWCLSSSGSITALPLSTSAKAFTLVAKPGSLRPLSIPHSIAVVGETETTVYQLKGAEIKQTLSIPFSVDAIEGSSLDGDSDDRGVVIVAHSIYSIAVYELEKGTILAKATLHSSPSRVPISSLLLSSPSSSSPSEYQAVAVSSDCRIESLVLDVKQTGEPFIEWTREEALARVTKVEMLDLPLSELQASIESEFEGEDLNVVGAFLRRITTQVHQVKRWAVESSKQLVSLTSSISFGRSGNLAEILGRIRNQDGVRGARSEPFERDFFNTRKLILLTTIQGVIYGLDNADGRLVWRLNVDEGRDHFSPLTSQLGEATMPVFMQRSAVHPGLNAIATALYKDKKSLEAVLVSFDPMNGKIVSTRRTPPVKRVDVLPKEINDHLHPLVIVLKSGKVLFEPELPTAMKTMPPLHVMDIDPETGRLEGFELKIVNGTGSLEKRWTGDLSYEKDEKAVIVQGKPTSQRVHSRGRVLIDRNVHYKYINPNLVAVASLDEVRQSLTINLIDSVSGQIVHTGRVSKVTGPVHLVHCEHWVAYSYWSEKSRRTELGILELYEGDELPESNVFDSFIPTTRQPTAIVASYIFSQGIEAMGVSETEQGATTRSLVMALPFGGLFEVTRRFVDATRPVEFTQEMREEGMVPYMPEIPIATEDMVNYNQSVYNIKTIKAFPSGLESTSLMLAYGLDMFYTRLTPSGTFDILKDDYDTGLITLVLVALFVGSYVCKRIVKRNSIKAAWA